MQAGKWKNIDKVVYNFRQTNSQSLTRESGY